MVWLLGTLGMFVFGSLAFWLLLVATTIGIIWSISELDRVYIDYYRPDDPDHIGGGAFATFTLCVFLALVVYSNHSGLSTMRFVPLIVTIVSYIALGIVTVFWKWSNYTQDLAAKFLSVNDVFFRDNKLNRSEPIPTQFKDRWNKDIGRYAQKPKEYRFMKLKTTWAAYWPWILFWSLLHDLVYRIFETILSFFNGFFARITEHHWKVVTQNMPTFASEPSVSQKATDESTQATNETSPPRSTRRPSSGYSARD